MTRHPIRVPRLLAAAFALALGASLLSLADPACAQAKAQGRREHAIPTCFDKFPNRSAGPLGDLTVLIDQTADLDDRIRAIVVESVDRLIRPATRVTVAAFSGYMPGRYLDILVSGTVESPIVGRERDFVPKRELRESDLCLGEQLDFSRKLVAQSIRAAFAASDTRLPDSEILSALRDMSRRSNEPATNGRLLIVVSDMLENSSITTFYQNNRPRNVDPDVEMRKVIGAGITANFHGTRVFVIGAGFATAGSPYDMQSSRDSRALLHLEEFWRRWFAVSNAEMVDFGKPTPLEEITWGPAEAAAAGNAH